MSDAAEELLDEAMRLPESERRLIALLLLDSVGEDPPEEIDRAWIDEALRRLEDLRAGRTRPIPWSNGPCRPRPEASPDPPRSPRRAR